MSWNRLSVYNVALAAIGERSLDSLSEDGEPLHELNAVWSRGGGVLRACLELHNWNWSLRTQKIDHDTSIEPAFGYAYAFAEPSDYIRLDMIGSGERFSEPLMRYEKEAGYFFADVDPIYIRFVSDDSDYGTNFGKWPESFGILCGYYMAVQIAPRYKNDMDMEKLEARFQRILTEARARDASQMPVRFPPFGSWAQSRLGQWYTARDGGSRSSFTG